MKQMLIILLTLGFAITTSACVTDYVGKEPSLDEGLHANANDAAQRIAQAEIEDTDDDDLALKGPTTDANNTDANPTDDTDSSDTGEDQKVDPVPNKPEGAIEEDIENNEPEFNDDIVPIVFENFAKLYEAVGQTDYTYFQSTTTDFTVSLGVRESISSIYLQENSIISSGDDVALVGFGTFTVSERAARDGINPLTKEKIHIPAAKAPKFKAGKALKDAVNKK